MVDILFPQTSTPGEHRQSGRGRLLNMFWEPIVTDDRPEQANKSVWRRAAGTKTWGVTTAPLATPFRNAFHAHGLLYAAYGGTMWKWAPGDIPRPGTSFDVVPGSAKIFYAKNNKATPDVVMVIPGEGARLLTPSGVAAYPDVDLPGPNSVCCVSSFFIFSIGDGRMFATEPNSTAINQLTFASAETKSDTLLRVVPVGNGQLLACGDNSMEVWGPPVQPPPGFPFSYISAMPYGIIGANALAGYEDGWTKGIFFVAPDYGVYALNNLQPLKVSPPDLDRLIKQTVNKDDIEVSVFGFSGRGIVVVQTPQWSWHFDTSTLKWHERQSYLVNYWRHERPVYAWGAWLAGDRKQPFIYVVDSDIETEAGDPLPAQITGVVDVFPAKTRVARIDLDITHGVGVTTGIVPTQTNPVLHVAYSVDGGVDWSDPVRKPFNQMGRPVGVCTVRNCGIVRAKQFKVKLTVSDPVYFALMGGKAEAA